MGKSEQGQERAGMNISSRASRLLLRGLRGSESFDFLIEEEPLTAKFAKVKVAKHAKKFKTEDHRAFDRGSI